MNIRGKLTTLVASSLLALAPISTYAQGRPMVIIDAGHGMGNRTRNVYDPGTSYAGVTEEKTVLDIAKGVGERLKQQGIEVEYTRFTSDYNTPLKGRIDLGNKANAQAYVSIHCNASQDPKTSGVEIFASNSADKLAFLTSSYLVDDLGMSNRGIMSGNNLAITRDITNCPSILIETGFLSNSEDRKKLTESKDKVSNSIANGIVSFLRGQK